MIKIQKLKARLSVRGLTQKLGINLYETSLPLQDLKQLEFELVLLL